VVGAVLGDGYLFRPGNGFLVGLDVRSKEFAERFAGKQSVVLGRKVKAHFYSGNRIWFVRVRSKTLFDIIERVRISPASLTSWLHEGEFRQNFAEFLSGFFDAEGCIKVVKEKERKTAKICLDITNTSKPLLDIVNSLVAESLGFAGRLSVQDDTRGSRKPAYHLRFYQKSHVEAVLSTINSPKLTAEKRELLRAWVSKPYGREQRPS
jgi:intein-encoded DNA endonuclease-like protein